MGRCRAKGLNVKKHEREKSRTTGKNEIDERRREAAGLKVPSSPREGRFTAVAFA